MKIFRFHYYIATNSAYKLNLFNNAPISSGHRNGQFVLENSESKCYFSGCVSENVKIVVLLYCMSKFSYKY